MNALELLILGRRLMKIAGDAMPAAGFAQLPSSVRSIALDVSEHPDTSIGEIAARTGFPQSHVSAAVARLRESGVLETAADPHDRRRTLVQASPQIAHLAAHPLLLAAPIDRALGAALDSYDPGGVAEVVTALETLARRLNPDQHAAAPSEAGRSDPAPDRRQPRQPADFDAAYAGTPPWDIGRPQPAFLELAQAGALRGRILDVGCGTGEHALMAAGLGLDATGIDSSPAAIATARRKARERSLTARFLVADALDLATLDEQFDTVLDCGLFHTFDDDDRARFVDSLRVAIPAGGRYHMLCFSDLVPGNVGPRRVTQEEIRAAFAEGWRVDAIEAATIEVLIAPSGVPAWRATITRA
jgi:SAM-dependent methyltransferase/DNA-binding MarR family transcriptional regulator